MLCELDSTKNEVIKLEVILKQLCCLTLHDAKLNSIVDILRQLVSIISR